ncbi:MAG TPA: polysaccharide deacetylase family protein [Solirubrobacteraceae bacterium]|nr:polysaccharide deacetylase family protein [Solirubrobacteraceae bacterium]
MYAHDHRIPAGALTGALAGLAAAGYMLPGLASSRPVLLPGSPEPIWRGLRRALGIEDRTAAGHGYGLTFDDGPHPRGTPAVLEILAREGVSATFFLVGEQIRRNPALVEEILAGGHHIGLHCDRHRNLLRLLPGQVRTDIERARDTIESRTGAPIALYRPPYGVANAAALALARRNGWRTLLWSQWGRDWEARATPASIAARVTAGAGEGSVLLLHDADEYSAPGSWRRTADALPSVLETLHERGLRAVLP